MGGHGSGRIGRGARRTDELRRFDLADFKRHWFERNFFGTCRWTRGGHEMGSIGYRLQSDCMHLHYSVGRADEKQSVDERFDFAFTEQPLGGMRRWIVCPSCLRRCRVIYGSKYFRCRQCYDATYASQYESIRVRGMARMQRVRDKLGGDGGLYDPFPRKPKGMHWKRYSRLQNEDRSTVERMERTLYAWLQMHG